MSKLFNNTYADTKVEETKSLENTDTLLSNVDSDFISLESDSLDLEKKVKTFELLESIEKKQLDMISNEEYFSHTSASMCNAAVEAMCITLDIDNVMDSIPSVEDHITDGNRALELSLESISDVIKKAWKSIVKFITGIVKKAKMMLVKLFNIISNIKDLILIKKKIIKYESENRNAKAAFFDNENIVKDFIMMLSATNNQIVTHDMVITSIYAAITHDVFYFFEKIKTLVKIKLTGNDELHGHIEKFWNNIDDLARPPYIQAAPTVIGFTSTYLDNLYTNLTAELLKNAKEDIIDAVVGTLQGSSAEVLYYYGNIEEEPVIKIEKITRDIDSSNINIKTSSLDEMKQLLNSISSTQKSVMKRNSKTLKSLDRISDSLFKISRDFKKIDENDSNVLEYKKLGMIFTNQSIALSKLSTSSFYNFIRANISARKWLKENIKMYEETIK